MKKIYLLTAITALIIGSCSKDNSYQEEGLMQFRAEYPTTKATATDFETGDQMGVFVTKYDNDTPTPLQISGNYANNIKSVFNGTKWENSPAIYWEDGKFDVYAFYPYSSLSSVDEHIFFVAADQSSQESDSDLGGYEASDFLWAKKAGVTQSDNQAAGVPLKFSHIMSKLVINLVKGENYSGDIPSDAVIKIHNTVPAATIDISNGIVTKYGYEPAKTITAKKVSNGVYTAIIVPQRMDNRVPLIEVLTNGVSYLVESKFVFRSGTQHTVNLKLDNNPDKVKIEIGGEIQEWNQ